MVNVSMISIGLGFNDSNSINHQKIVSSLPTDTMMSTADAVDSFNSVSRLTLWDFKVFEFSLEECSFASLQRPPPVSLPPS
jgi:hypothetical protein